ncbi:aspartate aminotransferase family protein [Streptomyces sp. NBC_00572]|uniref:aspartate aminotransferase family protein n=1 Tax=Streptomyces sp. NBC_00572 TaxID=2903664 RepID=UPI00224F5773|nr:aminotransferase class III-fold pyridoxal phosphate-dependent enzyme [Streptomyces sp. NBC_00572]MCX4987070.1 aminotransferase class III-fold pyridoxal phosphate-dependent enzyme [Streptomyces sp. NBC_00572]
MNSVSADPQLAEPYLLGWLASLGLDVDYVRAEGNTLYYLGANGAEIPVLDFAGGYGSLILGHNHPEITAYAQQLLASQTPVHAQFSRHPYANDVAVALNRILQRELGTEENYSAIFANTGAEAVEAAVKHAELDRGLRLAELREQLDANLAAARAAVADGAVVAAEAYRLVGVDAQAGTAGFEALAAAVAGHNAEQTGRPPVLLTLEGGFHGKLVGSVQLTHNEGYRAPFAALATPARFIPADSPQALKAVLESERATVFDLVVEGGTVSVAERNSPVFCAFVLEPIQGEGGIRVLSEEFAQEIQRACAEVDCPVIVDEVQSGMGRSGDFLASSALGLRGDYYALAKSLGGGIAKTSVMLTRQSRYRSEFELVHSSTFAKDALSCFISQKVLEILEADDGAAYRTVRERGAKLLGVLEGVRADFPDVVKDVRGRGLMLGLEFHDQSGSGSEAIRESAPLLGYTVAGYLMREHRIRTFPTASAVNTLRFEPSLYLTDAEIDQLERGLRGAAQLFRTHDGAGLTGTAADAA